MLETSVSTSHVANAQIQLREPASQKPEYKSGWREAVRHGRQNMLDRIVIINDLSIARGGGTGLALLSVKLFRQLDIAVTYICGDDGKNPDLAALGVEIMALGGEHILQASRGRALTMGIHNAGAEAMLADWISTHDTPGTVYHVHGWSKIMSPAIFRALSPVAERTVLHAHDYFLACPNGAFYNYRSHEVCEYAPLGASCLASNCDKRSYPQKLWRVGRSARIRQVLQGKQPSASRILLLHEKMVGPFERAGYPRAMLHTVTNPAVPYCTQRVRVEENSEFFFVGRLEDEKGVEEAAAAAIAAGVPLTIIGDGPLKDKLSSLGSPVTVLGWQSHDQIAHHIRRARALVMPTRYPEPFGLVAVEASQSGIPVILSKKAHLAEEIAAAGIGIISDTADKAAFVTTLRQVAHMAPADMAVMSLRAFDRVAPLATSPAEWRDALLGHYARLLSEASHAR